MIRIDSGTQIVKLLCTAMHNLTIIIDFNYDNYFVGILPIKINTWLQCTIVCLHEVIAKSNLAFFTC